MSPGQLLTLAALVFGVGLGLVGEAAARADVQERELVIYQRGVDAAMRALAADLGYLRESDAAAYGNEATGGRLSGVPEGSRVIGHPAELRIEEPGE